MATPEEIRRAREATAYGGLFNNFFATNRAYRNRLAQQGRRPVLGGLLSKEPVMGTDTLRYEGIRPFVGNLLEPIIKGGDTVRASRAGLIPQKDMIGEAFGAAGAAMLGGGLAAKPAGSLGANALFTRKPNNIMDEFRPETYYHGTRSDIDAFDSNLVDLGVHVGTKGQANERLNALVKKEEPVYSGGYAGAFDLPEGHSSRTPDSVFVSGQGPAENAQILPLKVRADYPLRMPDVGEWDRSEVVMYYIEKMLGEDGDPRLKEAFADFDFDGLDDVRDQFYDNDEWKASVENREFLDDIRDRIKDAGYDSIVYKNAVESSRDEGMQDSMIVLDPSNLRSVNAEFDPAYSNYPDLLAANASKSAGLLSVASDVSDRGDQILNMLKSGKGSEVTDAMLDMGDGVKNTQLNQYLAANYDLPLDEKSRLARAREMGFEGGLLHGTGADITAVNLAKLGEKQNVLGKGFYQTTNPQRSDRYVPKVRDDNGDLIYAEGGNVMPLMTKSADEFDLTVPTGKKNISRIAKAFEGSNYNVDLRDGGDSAFIRSKTDPNVSVFLDSYAEGQNTLMRLKDAFGNNNITPILKEAGFTGVRGVELDPRNVGGSTVRVNYNPEDVRSQFARFDPRLSHLSNVTAANASKAGGLLAAAQAGEKYFADDALQSYKRQANNPKSRETITYMSPQQFLNLAEKTSAGEKTKNTRKLLQEGTKFSDIPFLSVENQGSGVAQVVGHEGRNRMMALAEAGVESVPVRLNMLAGKGPSIRWGTSTDPNSFDYVDPKDIPVRLINQDKNMVYQMPDSSVYPVVSKAPVRGGLLDTGPYTQPRAKLKTTDEMKQLEKQLEEYLLLNEILGDYE